jgi:hydrogenase expression/formation protein HypE
MTDAVAPELQPPVRVLMGPGPSDTHPRVLAALAAGTVGHLDPYYLELMNKMQQMLRSVMRTENPMTMAISGTGSAGMEATVTNLIEPGDSMVVCVNGVFGGRMVDVAERAGARVTRVDRPWGQVFEPADLKDAIAKAKPKVVGIVMAETSTGARQPIEEISKLVHESGALLLVDAVTALGGIPVEVDKWKIDALYSGTQKCLSCPPGLSPFTVNQKALDVLAARKQPVPSWYLDLKLLSGYWSSSRFYHHTAPISMIYALHEAVALVLEEGLELAVLDRVVDSIAAAAKEAGVVVATGDTKVVERQRGDGLMITTAGVGVLRQGVDLGLERVQAGDAVLITGRIAEHGLAVMSAREGLNFSTAIESDVAPLTSLIEAILAAGGAGVKFLRDPTRGGVACVLADLAEGARLSVEVNEAAIPISPAALHTAELLGLDPLTIANEGKCVSVVAAEVSRQVLEACRAHPLGKFAAIVGTVTPSSVPLVELVTRIGGRRIVQRPYGEELPRIC